MAKLAGRWITVTLDDESPAAKDVSSDVDSIDIPMEFDELDITGFSDAVKNSMPGLPGFNVELTGTFNPTADQLGDVLIGIVGDYATHTLTVAVGANAAPAMGDPEFEGEFWCPKMQISASPTGKVVVTASLRVDGTTAPAWGTVA